MRVFLCAFEGFLIAIPMDAIASVALYADEYAEYPEEDRKSAISLPRLFNLPEEIIKHIIILKKQDDKTNYAKENNIMLLTTEIECEIDIPDERIFPLPKILGPTNFSALFSGIQFNSDKLSDTADGPLLLLNCKELNRFAQKEEVL